MLSPRFRVLTIACGVAVVMLVLCAGTSSAQYGCASCAAPTYVVPAVTYRAYYAPLAVATYRPVSTCGSCSGCATTAYQPVAGCNSCGGYGGGYSVGYGAVSTYRPLWGGWTTRLVPYTTYSPVIASPVAYTTSYAPCTSCSTVAYSPCSTCSSCTSCSPCSACSTCGDSCSTGTCGTTSGCSSCSVAAPASYETPVPAGQKKTFTEKPAIDNNIKPQPDTNLNSMPTPQLQDQSDRVTVRPAYAAPRLELTAQRMPISPVIDDGGWQASKD
jgi:hypothetical protein